MDVSQLTDAELRDTLIQNGVNVGPIVASTRKVYEKKLIKVIGGANNQSKNHTDLNGSQILEDASEQSFEPIFKKQSLSPKTKSPPPRVFHQSSSEAAAVESDSDDGCEESMRYLTEEEMAADRAYARQLQGTESKGGFLGNTLTFAAIFVFIAVFAYFLIENAEQLKLLTEPNPEDTV
uniref:LEM domain-containing protein n=1 Tax=Caenorhabditis tropicalis TaxID=1561998 RepID=A0A1I7UE75_9PELO